MKTYMTAILTGALAVTAMAGAAQAEHHGSDHKAAVKPAVSDPAKTTHNPNAPVEGANSFTEGQAQDRLVQGGYTNISALTKNEQGQWYGTATKGGISHKVLVDYQGNVTTEK